MDGDHRKQLTFFFGRAGGAPIPQGNKAAAFFSGLTVVILEKVEEWLVIRVFDQNAVGV